MDAHPMDVASFLKYVLPLPPTVSYYAHTWTCKLHFRIFLIHSIKSQISHQVHVGTQTRAGH